MKSQDEFGLPVIGCQPDWSFLPLKQELRKAGKAELKIGNDLALNRMLLNHELESAACSPMYLLRNPNFEMAAPAGLATKGESANCYFGLSEDFVDLPLELQTRIDNLKEIFHASRILETGKIRQAAQYVAEASKSLPLPRGRVPKIRFLSHGCAEATLARILYKFIWGDSAFQTNEIISTSVSSDVRSYPGPHLDFLCKNEAIQKRPRYADSMDLVKIWYAITGLPFVSAVWQKCKSHPSVAAKHGITSASERAQVAMKIEPSSYYPNLIPIAENDEGINFTDLWKNLSYKIGPLEIRSFLFFLQLALPLERRQLDEDEFAVKMIRWQERGFET